MSDKRIVMKPGFLVRHREIKECHFKKCMVSEEYYEDSTGYLILIGESLQLVKDYKKELFETTEKAEAELRRQKESHVEFCQDQIESYTKSLNKAVNF